VHHRFVHSLLVGSVALLAAQAAIDAADGVAAHAAERAEHGEDLEPRLEDVGRRRDVLTFDSVVAAIAAKAELEAAVIAQIVDVAHELRQRHACSAPEKESGWWHRAARLSTGSHRSGVRRRASAVALSGWGYTLAA
jgi:hypothetical protein